MSSQKPQTVHVFSRPAAFPSNVTPVRTYAEQANAGERDLTLEAPAGHLTVTDLMGNRKKEQAKAGVVTLHLNGYPVYLSGGGAIAISHRIDASLENSTTEAERPQVRLDLKNNQDHASKGEVFWQGAVASSSPVSFEIDANQSASFSIAASPNLPSGKRSVIRAEVRCDDGTVFGATSGFNFAFASMADAAPKLDGTWTDWKLARPVDFGTADQVNAGSDSKDHYRGPSDISGRLRFLWDQQNLYLGVEAIDDHFVSVQSRGRSGFQGDSIEFGIQPQNILSPSAPYFEYELYLPNDGLNKYAASRRMPPPEHLDDLITSWHAAITPGGR